VPFPTPAFGHATRANVFDGTEGARRFLLWPAGEATPDDVPCRLPAPTAVFRPARTNGTLARLVALYAREHGFVETSLFEVPADCGRP
jgi:hypothetical protein